ncbi:MAG TPA: hypothetical protein PKC49_00015 [Phycisphaerae bacterium]|nr:hypothetical protein [Phycisphaerae bacterium]
MSGALDEAIRRAEQLVVRSWGNGRDLWLWEHCLRVMRSADLLAAIPELLREQADPTAATLAGLYYDAGWAVQARDGGLQPWQVLARPTSNVQRELAAGALLEHCTGILPVETVTLAAEAIRECNNRFTTMPEAQVVSEAANLDEFGLMYVLRQFRLLQAEGRRLEDLLATWTRQQEYRYWQARVDVLRFPQTREIARRRLAAVADFMDALARDAGGADLRDQVSAAAAPPKP